MSDNRLAQAEALGRIRNIIINYMGQSAERKKATWVGTYMPVMR